MNGSLALCTLWALCCFQWTNAFLKCLQLQTFFSTAHAIMPLALCSWRAPALSHLRWPSFATTLWIPLGFILLFAPVLCVSLLPCYVSAAAEAVMHLRLYGKYFPSVCRSWPLYALVNICLCVLENTYFCRWSGTHGVSWLLAFCLQFALLFLRCITASDEWLCFSSSKKKKVYFTSAGTEAFSERW